MNQVIHDPKCIKMHEENQAWLKLWPKSCKVCQGVGSWNHPGGQYEPPDGGPCEGEVEYDKSPKRRDPKVIRDCVAEGACPRCGYGLILFNVLESSDSSDYGLCPGCGWNEYLVVNRATVARELGMVMPHAGWECECWITELLEEPQGEVSKQDKLLADFQHDPDPLDYDAETGKWFFWYEDWATKSEMFDTEVEARSALIDYARSL